MWFTVTYDVGQGPQKWEVLADYESDAIEKCWDQFGKDCQVLEVQDFDPDA